MADGKIRININAYSGTKGLTPNALSHELTHFIKQRSPDKYKALAEYLIKTYEGTDMTMHKRVVREQNRLKKICKEDVSYDEAYDEVVANAFNRLLEDGKVMERIAEIRQMDKSLAEKIIERIRDFIKRFTNAYRRNPSYFLDSEALMEMKEAVDQLQEMFAEALVEASDNFRAAQGIVDSFVKEYKESHKGQMFSNQQTDRQQYNSFREKFAKERLDLLSDKLGNLFPLSAGFEQAIQNDETPVSNMIVVANSQKRANGESFYTAAKNAFRSVYGAKTTFSIKQLGISAEADESFARESMSKVSDTKDLQTLLDLNPVYKQLIEDSRLLAVERTRHNDNKKPLSCAIGFITPILGKRYTLIKVVKRKRAKYNTSLFSMLYKI